MVDEKSFKSHIEQLHFFKDSMHPKYTGHIAVPETWMGRRSCGHNSRRGNCMCKYNDRTDNSTFHVCIVYQR